MIEVRECVQLLIYEYTRTLYLIIHSSSTCHVHIVAPLLMPHAILKHMCYQFLQILIS